MSTSSSSEEAPPLHSIIASDGLLPVSCTTSTKSTLPAYISTLAKEEFKKKDFIEGRLRQRHKNGTGSLDFGEFSESQESRKLRQRKGKRRGIRQVCRDWNSKFEKFVSRVESWAEYVIHCILRTVEFILLTIQKVCVIVLSKIRKQWAIRFGTWMHNFTRPVSIEERTAVNRNRQYIWILYELRRKFIIDSARRMYLYRMIAFCFVLAILLSVGLFYTAEIAEYNSHIRYMSKDTRTGVEIMNLIYPPEFPRAGYNEDVEWLLYNLREKENAFEKLLPPTLKSDYVEIETRRFSRVNISISELVSRMMKDSSTFGNKMLQPCLCPVHYGIPLNIILVRYSLEDADNGDVKKEDVVYYEPRVTTYVSDTVRGSTSMDTLVIPPEVRLKKSGGLSVLEYDFNNKHKLSISNKHEERRTLVVDLTDSLVGPYLHLRGSDDTQARKQVYERTRNMVSQENIDGMKESMQKYKFKGELSIGYATMGIRSLNAQGEKLPVAYIESPYSYCVQRCLAAIDPYF